MNIPDGVDDEGLPLTRLKLRKGTLSWHLTRLTEQKALEEDLLTDYAGERKFVHSVVIRKRLLINKNVATLRKYISERGKILPRRISGSCAKHQREITVAIKKARHIALLPYVVE